MPFQTLIELLVAAVGAAALAIMAGGSASEVAHALTEAVQTVEQAKAMADEAVIWYSLAGGVLGGVCSWALGFLPRDLGEGCRKILGSAFFAVIAAPAVVIYMQFPRSLIYIISVSGGIGLVADMVLSKVLPLASNLMPAWLLKLFSSKSGVDLSPYDVEDNRSRAARQKEQEKATKLSSPPDAPPRRFKRNWEDSEEGED